MLARNILETLRPLMVNKSWDYIVLWKLSNDHRCLELMNCICGGTQNIETNGETSFSPTLRCKDIMFSHPITESCALLDNVSPSIPLDSGVHAEAFLSNHSSWLHLSYKSDSYASEETFFTRVLVPLPCGLLELFVTTKQVPEDQQVIEFIKLQCNILSEESNSGCVNSIDENISAQSYLSDANLQNALTIFQQQISSYPSTKNSDLFPYNNSILSEGTNESDHFTPSSEPTHSNMMSISRFPNWMEPTRPTKEYPTNENMIPLIVEENNRSDDSDIPNNIGDEINDGKHKKKTGKGHQCKNLEAERKRRKKLNDRLYTLRALVPNISKLDRGAILGDAINYVKELQKQVKDLQIELEGDSDDENVAIKNTTHKSRPIVTSQQNRTKSGTNTNREYEIFSRDLHKVVKNTHDSVQQMEPQVEVFQVDGNEFFIKVFCEYKHGGFVRLIEAISCMGFQVNNVNATRHTCLVSCIFRVEKRDNEFVEADHLKESLLELARDPS